MNKLFDLVCARLREKKKAESLASETTTNPLGYDLCLSTLSISGLGFVYGTEIDVVCILIQSEYEVNQTLRSPEHKSSLVYTIYLYTYIIY